MWSALFLKGWLGKCSDLAESQGPILFFFLPLLIKVQCLGFFFSLMECFPSEYVFVFAKSAKLFTLGYFQKKLFLLFFSPYMEQEGPQQGLPCFIFHRRPEWNTGYRRDLNTLSFYYRLEGWNAKHWTFCDGSFNVSWLLFLFSSSFPLRAIIVCVRLRIGGLSRNAEERGAE